MAKKQKDRPQKKSRSSRGRARGRKACTPVLFSPSAKGSGITIAEAQKEPASLGAQSASVTSQQLTSHSLSDVPQDELRDIGELSLGKRDRTAEPEAPDTIFSASSSAERVRIQAAEITQSPWRKVCDLLITARDGSLHTGTAWFISPRTLVTAGHCISVFSPNSPAHGMVRKILVMPARNGEADAAHSPFGWVEVPREDLRVHPNWANSGNLNFDYGVIILPATAPLGEQTGVFGFGHFEDQKLAGSAPTLSGYPDNVPDGTQWVEVNPIRDLTATRVFYDIFTFGGQSGSPVFFRNNNRQIACAVHNFGDVPFNSGVRINQDVIDQLNAWKV
ncbi:MAG TPA: trypsin-like serine protease [Pyrinomonadaceae bacterium]|nr:trypsin-like serine protease [Pyrinomonadaceae bacterium]